MSSASTSYLSPSAAGPYLQRMIMTTLQRRGFSSAEAGALAEFERLLQHHVQSLFERAQSTAELCGRHTPHSNDLLYAHEMVSSGSVRQLHKVSKKRRALIPLETTEEPPSPKREITLGSLPELHEGDIKPELTPLRSGEKLEIAWEGVPDLPPKWTYDTKPSAANPTSENESRPQLSSSLLDFIKLTATERGDIAPELGLVNYRSVEPDRSGGGPGSGTGSGTEKRRKVWGVKGVGVNA